MKPTIVSSSEVIEENRKKIVPIDTLKNIDTPFIFTKGVFDIIHGGHLSLFSYIGNIKESHKLVVGLTSDRITRLKKGNSRPINNEQARLDQIAALSVVDYIFIHDEAGYENAISLLKPSIYIKGMDTAYGENNKNNNLSENNLELNHLPNDSGFIIFCDDGSLSTTDIINNIKSRS